MKRKLDKYRKIDGWNVFEISENNLLKMGYKKIEKKLTQKGDLLCLTNSEKNLWAELDNFTKLECNKFIVLRNE